MSTYKQFTKHPETGEWENAEWHDDHFGPHAYGVEFPSDPKRYFAASIYTFEVDDGLAECEYCKRIFKKRGLKNHQNKCKKIKELERKGEKLLDDFRHVTNPPHYQGKTECIEIIKNALSDKAFEGYLTGNIMKYLYRWKDKNGVEDLKKAKWYLEYLIKLNEI